MSAPRLRFVFLGLSITSSWGNGHATTYRSLLREIVARGHDVLFLERDVPWYADNRDCPSPPYGRTELYANLDELRDSFTADVRDADVVVVGSYVPEGVAVGEWVQRTARGVATFYDIDTPVTLARLERGDEEYLAPRLVPGYHLYLSFTGGPTLRRIEREFGSPAARVLYCSVDPSLYRPEAAAIQWDMAYLGTYGADRQPRLEQLLMEPARRWPEGRFLVAGPLYPDGIVWPTNVARIEHLPPAEHRAFYNAQRITLNVTRADMVAAGYSPSVRLFEAAACGTAILSDWWEGLDSLFEIGQDILVASSTGEAFGLLRHMPEEECRRIGENGRRRVLAAHTAAHRAEELEGYVLEVLPRLLRASPPAARVPLAT